MLDKTINKDPLHDRNLYMVFIMTLFASMDIASMAPASRKMMSFFSISEKEVGWLNASFTLPGLLLSPFIGFLADRPGRKNVLVPSPILFGIAYTPGQLPAMFLSGTAIAVIIMLAVLLFLRKDENYEGALSYDSALNNKFVKS